MKLRRLVIYTTCLLIVPAAVWQVYKRLLRTKDVRNMEEKKETNPEVDTVSEAETKPEAESNCEEEEKVDFAKQRAEFNERLKHLDKVENTKEMQKRYERYKVFDQFQEIAKDAFETLRDEDPRGLIYQAFNMLSVCPGSRMGMDKRDIVEVFWGSKIYDREYRDKSGDRLRFKFNTESGATLYFLRKDNGLVDIYLFPSTTDKRKSEEDGILLKDDVEPKKLLGKWYRKRLWWSFMAYTEVTSLDGSPTLWQRIRVAKNRFVKPKVIEGVVQQRVVVRWIGKTLWWVFTVGLSGCLVTVYYDWKNDDKDEVRQSLERIDDTLKDDANKDSVEIKAVSDKVESLSVGVHEILSLQKGQKR